MAIWRHHNELAHLLIDAGADTTIHPEYNEKSPLWRAVEAGHLSIFKTLAAAGADLTGSGCNRHSVLMVMVERNFIEAMKILIDPQTTAGLLNADVIDRISDRVAVNFGASDFSYPIPAGYRSWDGKQRG